jgi:hypothetical protein
LDVFSNDGLTVSGVTSAVEEGLHLPADLQYPFCSWLNIFNGVKLRIFVDGCQVHKFLEHLAGSTLECGLIRRLRDENVQSYWDIE